MIVDEDEAGQGYRNQLKLADIKRDVAQQRLQEAWELYSSYGIVHGDCPKLPAVNDDPLWEVAASYFPSQFSEDHRNCPEGYVVAAAVKRDLEVLDTIVDGEFAPHRCGRYMQKQNFVIEIDEGTLDVSYMALAGILTPTVLDAHSTKTYTHTKDSYSIYSLAKELGMCKNKLGANVSDGYLCDRFALTPGRREGEHQVSQTVADAIFRWRDKGMLRSHLESYIRETYGQGRATLWNKLDAFTQNPATFLGEDHPYHGVDFETFALFGEYVTFDLRTVHHVANIVLRDKRIIDTHGDSKAMASLLGINGRTLRKSITLGTIPSRKTTFLSVRGRAANYLSVHDLSSREALEQNVSTAALVPLVRRNGVLATEQDIAVFLWKNGLVDQGFLHGRNVSLDKAGVAVAAYCQDKDPSAFADPLAVLEHIPDLDLSMRGSGSRYQAGLMDEEIEVLTQIIHGDGCLELLIPDPVDDDDKMSGARYVAQAYIRELIQRDAIPGLARRREEYWRLGLDNVRSEDGFFLRALFLEFDLTPRYMALLWDYLETTSTQGSRAYDAFYGPYRAPEYTNVLDALGVAQGKIRSSANKGYKWEGPTTFSHATLNELGRYRRGVAKAYRRVIPRMAKARQLLRVAKLHLCDEVARGYSHPDFTHGDFVNEGMFGLERATQLFDYRRGKSFDSYAKSTWIRAKIRRLARSGGSVRVTEHGQAVASQVRKVQWRRSQREGKRVSLEDVLAQGDIPQDSDAVRETMRAIHRRNNSKSLNAPAYQDGRELAEQVSNDEAPLPDTNQDQTELRHLMLSALGSLDPVEARVLVALHVEGATKADLSSELGVNRNRLRDIEVAALGKLRSGSHSENLALFY